MFTANHIRFDSPVMPKAKHIRFDEEGDIHEDETTYSNCNGDGNATGESYDLQLLDEYYSQDDQDDQDDQNSNQDDSESDDMECMSAIEYKEYIKLMQSTLESQMSIHFKGRAGGNKTVIWIANVAKGAINLLLYASNKEGVQIQTLEHCLYMSLRIMNSDSNLLADFGEYYETTKRYGSNTMNKVFIFLVVYYNWFYDHSHYDKINKAVHGNQYNVTISALKCITRSYNVEVAQKRKSQNHTVEYLIEQNRWPRGGIASIKEALYQVYPFARSFTTTVSITSRALNQFYGFFLVHLYTHAAQGRIGGILNGTKAHGAQALTDSKYKVTQ